MDSLFPSAGNDAAGNSALLTIKAGMCAMTLQDNGKYKVTPTPGKGQITLTKQDESTVLFKWTNRTSNVVGMEKILLPNSVTFKKAKTGKDTDRVYYMKVLDDNEPGNKTTMFWIQDKNSGKDDSACKKFNDIIANPSNFGNSERSAMPRNALLDLLRAQGGFPGASPGTVPGAIPGISVPSAGSQNTTTSGATPASTSSTQNTAGSSLGGIDFSSLLGGNTSLPPAPVAAPPIPAANIENIPQVQPTRLEETVTGERVVESGILEIPEVRDALVALLPPGQQSPEFLEANIRSPQLRQAMQSLTAALNSSDYYSVFANLGVDAAAGQEHIARGDMVRAFLTAIQAAAPTDASTEEKTEEEEDGDTKMDEG